MAFTPLQEMPAWNLLIVAQSAQIHWCRGVGRNGHGSGHQPRVVTPVEAAPQPLQQLAMGVGVLQVRGLVELSRRDRCGRAVRRSGRRCAPAPADLRRKEARGHRRSDKVGADSRGTEEQSARKTKPGIFELCQSMGKVMGVLPSTLKSKALCVYFQMYSPLTTSLLPKAC